MFGHRRVTSRPNLAVAFRPPPRGRRLRLPVLPCREDESLSAGTRNPAGIFLPVCLRSAALRTRLRFRNTIANRPVYSRRRSPPPIRLPESGDIHEKTGYRIAFLHDDAGKRRGRRTKTRTRARHHRRL